MEVRDDKLSTFVDILTCFVLVLMVAGDPSVLVLNLLYFLLRHVVFTGLVFLLWFLIVKFKAHIVFGILPEIVVSLNGLLSKFRCTTQSSSFGISSVKKHLS